MGEGQDEKKYTSIFRKTLENVMIKRHLDDRIIIMRALIPEPLTFISDIK